ncbi:hypothetical protein PZB74_20680 [Porifericola rhodea]|uniref:hypothetical protein n=1 Tax=Porifericola rhodea TaxID=930972 RepID=UPI002665C956|nr:hypothetical protein [Porifericola rhodea]WKN31369.1 hypothetical protein PZB74_20680 [Porifericola rhodea]
MEEFFYATVETATGENDENDRLYRTFYDQDKVRFQRNDGEGEIEFSLHDSSKVLMSHLVPVEDIEQLSVFLRDNQDIIQARLKGEWIEVEEDMDKFFKTPKWLSLPWINLSQVCIMLYGKKDKSTTAYFTLKRQGKRPWKAEELDRLEEIRKQMIKQVQAA